MTFDGMSIIAILIVLVVGYLLGRIWTTPAQMLGLP
jgi:hypothetical protein